MIGAVMVLLLAVQAPCLGAEATEVREWTSSVGTSLQAKALSCDGEMVTLEKADGSTLALGLHQLDEAGQEFLRKHFALQDEPAGAAASERGAAPSDLEHPLGAVVGPIDAGASKYFLYQPKSLVAGRPAPLLFITGAGGGNSAMVARHKLGAELNGWIVAMSVESKNGRASSPFIKDSLAHIKANVPIDPERIYYTGGSGGGVRAIVNLVEFGGIGAMPVIAHGGIDELPSKANQFYFIGGAHDYNRYGTAYLRAHYGKNAFHRFHPGGHSAGPADLAEDGMIWLNGRFLREQRKESAFADETADYEQSLLTWLQKMKSERPYRALMIADYLLNDYEIGRENRAAVESLARELSADPLNVQFLEGLKALDELSEDELSQLGGSSRKGHESPKVNKVAQKLIEKYPGVPELGPIFENLQQKCR